jgi:hypothetical protein
MTWVAKSEKLDRGAGNMPPGAKAPTLFGDLTARVELVPFPFVVTIEFLSEP